MTERHIQGPGGGWAVPWDVRPSGVHSSGWGCIKGWEFHRTSWCKAFFGLSPTRSKDNSNTSISTSRINSGLSLRYNCGLSLLANNGLLLNLTRKWKRAKDDARARPWCARYRQDGRYRSAFCCLLWSRELCKAADSIRSLRWCTRHAWAHTNLPRMRDGTHWSRQQFDSK